MRISIFIALLFLLTSFNHDRSSGSSITATPGYLSDINEELKKEWPCMLSCETASPGSDRVKVIHQEAVEDHVHRYPWLLDNGNAVVLSRTN